VHGLDNLGDIQVVAVVIVIVLKLTVIVEVAYTGLGVDEILNPMCPLDLWRTFALASGLLLLGILCKELVNACSNDHSNALTGTYS
jgi:hypothetical protein